MNGDHATEMLGEQANMDAVKTRLSGVSPKRKLKTIDSKLPTVGQSDDKGDLPHAFGGGDTRADEDLAADDALLLIQDDDDVLSSQESGDNVLLL